MIVGLTSGCFDLFHHGHLTYLQRCRSQCDRLIVGVDSDEMVRAAKGPLRPIITEAHRFDIVSNQSVVYCAFILRKLEHLSAAVKRYKVNKLFKHESFWNMENVYGLDAGAELAIVPDIPGMISTTQIIQTILERYQKNSQ